jgi:hypothetical protein
MADAKTYEEYVAMIERNGFGEPMTRDQWEAAGKSED